MYAAISGSFAIRLVQSSYIGSQYSVFFIPSAYRFAKRDSRCIARMADENMVIGWVSRGIARRTSNTYWGTRARDLKSSTTANVSSFVGTSPVIRKYQNPSTYGYSDPGTFGSAAKVSGIVLPRKRIPSIGSRYEMSVTRLRMPRAPPTHCSIVTWSIRMLPCSFTSFVVRGRWAWIFSKSFALRFDTFPLLLSPAFSATAAMVPASFRVVSRLIMLYFGP